MSGVLRRIEQLIDELDLALNAWLLVMDVAALYGSDSFNPAQGCFD